MSCPNCASWRAAWQARNQADEDRAAELARRMDALARDVEALADAMHAEAPRLWLMHAGAASMMRRYELEVADIAAQLRGL